MYPYDWILLSDIVDKMMKALSQAPKTLHTFCFCFDAQGVGWANGVRWVGISGVAWGFQLSTSESDRGKHSFVIEQIRPK